MMQTVWKFCQDLYVKVINSIAFYPAIITFASLAVFFLISHVEYTSFSLSIKEKIPFLLITQKEEAHLVLGTLVGSIISLMVFSFSMVMVVLNRASSNLSPRILPGLISDKSHQFVLGFYLATIVYCLLLIITFQDNGDHQVPSLGMLLAMAAGIGCLCSFIFFIHSISQAIQVENILHDIHLSSKKCMEQLLIDAKQDPSNLPNMAEWPSYCLTEYGYLKKIDTEGLLVYLKEKDLKIWVRKPVGYFVVDNFPLVKINKDGLDESLLRGITSYFHFYREEIVRDHYYFGFQQISEIAVKALSPGINDPGTAVKAMDYLSLLLGYRLQGFERLYEVDEDDEIRIVFHPMTVQELMIRTLIPIRAYAQGDVTVLLKLLETLRNVLYAADGCEERIQDVKVVIDSCLEMMESSLQNSLDRQEINTFLQSIHQVPLTPLTVRSEK